MSSLVDSTFVEEYYTATKEFTVNQATAISNSSNDLVITTSIIQDGALFLVDNVQYGNKLTPDNTNLIVDNIALFSTNVIDEFLPLKVSVNTKPQIEFANVTFSQLLDMEAVTNHDRDLVYPIAKSVQCRQSIDIDIHDLQAGGTISFPVQTINNVHLDGIIYFAQLFDVQYIKVDTTTRLVTVNNLAGDIRAIRAIKANEQNAIMVYLNQGNELIIYDLVAEMVLLTLPAVSPTIPDYIYRSLDLINEYLYLLVYERVTGIGHFYLLIPKGESVIIVDYQETNPPISNTIRDFLYTRQYNRAVSLTGQVYQMVIDNTHNANQFSWELLFQHDIPMGSYVRMAFGGDERPNRILNLFFDDGVYLYQYQVFAQTPIQQNRWRMPFPGNINIYQNLAIFNGFPANKYLIILDLTRNSFLNYQFSDYRENEHLPYTFISAYLSDEGLSINGFKSVPLVAPLDTITQIVRYYPNKRTANQVSKYTYNYSERTYPFRLKDNQVSFGILLPNGKSVQDLEIFKVVIDYRIRFAKQRQDEKLTVNTTTKGKKLKSSELTADNDHKIDPGPVFSLQELQRLYLPPDKSLFNNAPSSYYRQHDQSPGNQWETTQDQPASTSEH